MAKPISVLLVSPSSHRLNALEDVFFDVTELAVSRKLIGEGQSETLTSLGGDVDVMVVDLGADWQAMLDALAGPGKPPLIVIGRDGEADMMRRAMQVGARDFFAAPIAEQELIASIRRVGADAVMNKRQGSGDITVLMNGKGGSGASFLSATFGTMLATRVDSEDGCVVVDMDLQFGNLPVYLDLPPDDHLVDGLRNADSLDPLALNGLMKTHSTGLRVLASQPEGPRSLADVTQQQVQTLMTALSSVCGHVLVDLPRSLDPLSVAALEIADRVIVVAQQTVPHVRDARYLVGLLRGLGLPSSRLSLMVNRHDKRGEVRLDDVGEAFRDMTVHAIPNDYKRASFSVNNGIALIDKWPRAPIVKSMRRTADQIWDEPDEGAHAGVRRRTR